MENENPYFPNPNNQNPGNNDQNNQNNNNNNNNNQNFGNPNQNPNQLGGGNYTNPNQNFNNPYQQQQSYNPNMGPYQVPVPNSTAVLVLGILSLVTFLCYGIVGLILAIIGMVMAKKANEEYLANPSRYTEASYSNVKAGRICSIIGLILSILTIIAYIAYFVFVFSMIGRMARF